MISAFFLVALAIENLLKGLWIGRNYEAVKKAKSVKELKEIKKHDLDQIAKSAGLSLTSDEESLLSDLTKLIVWHGRYILPTTSEAYAPQFLNGPPSSRFLKGNGILNMELPMPQSLDQFIERLVKELDGIPEEQRR